MLICCPFICFLECKRIERLDIVFVLDSSGSIGEANYTLMKNFMIGFVNKTEVGKNQVQFGALKYSDDPETLFYLNSYSTKPAIIEHIRNDALLGQNTYTAKALRHSEHLFSEERGSRKRRNVPQVLIVITDGDSHDKAQLPEVSERLRARHIDIHAVGIKGANPAELLTIAGSKDKFYYVDTFEELSNLSKTITSKLCNASNQGKIFIHCSAEFLHFCRAIFYNTSGWGHVGYPRNGILSVAVFQFLFSSNDLLFQF